MPDLNFDNEDSLGDTRNRFPLLSPKFSEAFTEK